MNASTPALSTPFESASPRVFNPWLIALAVVVPTFMEVLDTTIANVALRYIAGGLSAAVTDSEWVITRILERQKMLQTGQVLFRRLSVEFALVLPIKDSSEAAEPAVLHPSRSNCRISLAGLRRRLARVGEIAGNARTLGTEESLAASCALLGVLVRFRRSRRFPPVSDAG
jgi:hypothetical protein